jgi:hypothetical protein
MAMNNSESISGASCDEGVAAGRLRIAAAWLTATILVGYCCTSFYAALNCRGLYADASHYLLKIAEKEHFHLFDPPRRTVQVLRQAAVVFLRRETDLELFQLGQVFSLSMLVLPVVLCGLCWLILPPERKSWIVFPLLTLLAGVSASSFAPIGEGALAASCLWPLFLLFLFRVDRPIFQIVFLLFCIPALFLHEAAFTFMLIFLFVCVRKFANASLRSERVFLSLCAILFVLIIANEIRWIIHPLNAFDRDGYITGLLQLSFVVRDGRWNLPLLTGAIGLIALAAIAMLRLESTKRIASGGTLAATLIFIIWAMCAAALPWLSDATFSPLPQMAARNQAVFVGSALAAAAAVTLDKKIPPQFWLRPATLVVIAALACAQLSWDAAATKQWRAYIADVRGRLAAADGLIGWERALALGDPDKNKMWRVMGSGWTMPSLSVVLQSGSSVRSMIAAPKGTFWQPFDPSNLSHLPRIRGVDYSAYIRAMRAAKPFAQTE